jgi:hypothetical protein
LTLWNFFMQGVIMTLRKIMPMPLVLYSVLGLTFGSFLQL